MWPKTLFPVTKKAPSGQKPKAHGPPPAIKSNRQPPAAEPLCRRGNKQPRGALRRPELGLQSPPSWTCKFPETTSCFNPPDAVRKKKRWMKHQTFISSIFFCQILKCWQLKKKKGGVGQREAQIAQSVKQPTLGFQFRSWSESWDWALHQAPPLGMEPA